MLSITNTINIGLEIPVNIIRQKKEIGDVKIRNKMIKLPFFFFADRMIAYPQKIN